MTTPKKDRNSNDNATERLNQRPNAESIPCPALLAFYNQGLLQPDERGNVALKQLEKVLESVGLSPMVQKILVRAADGTDKIPDSFNLFHLRESNLDHTGSTGIRDPEVTPEELDEALLRFSEGGRMYLSSFAAVAAHACSKDPGLKGTMIQNVELSALVEVFGRVDEKGRRYLTVEDVKGLWIDGKYPESWTPRAPGEVGLDDVMGGASWMAALRFLKSWT